MLKFIHKRVYNRDNYYPDCPKSKALLKLFGFEFMTGKDPMAVFTSIVESEIFEFPVKPESIPKGKRK